MGVTERGVEGSLLMNFARTARVCEGSKICPYFVNELDTNNQRQAAIGAIGVLQRNEYVCDEDIISRSIAHHAEQLRFLSHSNYITFDLRYIIHNT